MEMTNELKALLGQRLHILTPRTGRDVLQSAREVGRFGGHKWEQLELPGFVKQRCLINLGNTAPVACRRQFIVIHDAGVFEVPEAYGWRFRLWYKTIQYWLGRNGTTILTVSESSRVDIARHLRIPERRILVVPEGTDHLDRIEADESILDRSGLQKGRFVLAVGNLAAHKNLAALSSLARMLPTHGAQLVVAGHLKGDAFSGGGLTGLPQPALYLGRVTDAELKALYKSAACYVFPSRYEGYGLPAAEAMRCGCPVVASDIPALRESCGDAALYSDPGSPDAFADSVARILTNETLREELVIKGLLRTKHQTWRYAAQRLVGIVEETLRPAYIR
jgi:glycosyltransferase involved in cell wall biosynthesis